MVNKPAFINFITACVVVNVFCMAANYYQIPDELDITLSFLNRLCSVIFNLELVLKLIALKSAFFYNTWN